MTSESQRVSRFVPKGMCFAWRLRESSFFRTLIAVGFATVLLVVITKFVSLQVPNAFSGDGGRLPAVRVLSLEGNSELMEWILSRSPQSVLSAGIGELASVDAYLDQLGLEEPVPEARLYEAPLLISAPEVIEELLPAGDALPKLPLSEFSERPRSFFGWRCELFVSGECLAQIELGKEVTVLTRQLSVHLVVGDEGQVVMASFEGGISGPLADALRSFLVGQRVLDAGLGRELRFVKAEIRFSTQP